MADHDERDATSDDTDEGSTDTDENPTGTDLLPDADPAQSSGAKYAKDEKVNYGEDMLP